MTQKPASENSIGSLKAAAYCRTSLDDLNQVVSEKLRIQFCQNIAESKGWTLIGVYTDEGNENAAKEALLTSCRNREVDIVTIRSLSVLDCDLHTALIKASEFLMLEKPVGVYIIQDDVFILSGKSPIQIEETISL